mmetsp:Transcript_137/g.1076  ORF Transcript_137/g.1076 Transcript_137/m.1076 type:complete len:263 (+) Transcript_137:899-1687(+)
MRYSFLVSVTYCHTFVSPGIGADLQAFLPLSVLMTEDLPTLGYPTNPTQVTCFLLLKRESCLSKEKRAPFPKGFVTLAWKASVGYSFERNCTHFLVTDAGIRSHLFKRSTICFCFPISNTFLSKCLHRVPMGSLASRTSMSTSELSITLNSSDQILLDCPFCTLLGISFPPLPPSSTSPAWKSISPSLLVVKGTAPSSFCSISAESLGFFLRRQFLGSSSRLILPATRFAAPTFWLSCFACNLSHCNLCTLNTAVLGSSFCF